MIDRNKNAGFTLLEIIITMVLVAILGALLFNLMGDQLLRSGLSVVWTENESVIEASMESVVTDYVTLMNDSSVNKTTVLNTLVTRNNAGRYGTGVTMRFISFTAGGTEVAGGNLLKVTVNRSGHILTNIFTQSRVNSGDEPVNY